MAKKVWPVPSSYLAKDDDEVPCTHTDFILRLEFLFNINVQVHQIVFAIS